MRVRTSYLVSMILCTKIMTKKLFVENVDFFKRSLVFLLFGRLKKDTPFGLICYDIPVWAGFGGSHSSTSHGKTIE